MPPVIILPQLVGASGGWVHSAAVSPVRPPADYTARVIPYGDGVAIPLENARILWPDDRILVTRWPTHSLEVSLRLNSAFKSTQATIAFVWVLSAAYALFAVLAAAHAGVGARLLAAGAVVGLAVMAMRITRDIRGGRAM